MIASDSGDLRYTQTSPGGVIYRSNWATAITAVAVAAAPLESGTASTYEISPYIERTAAGPAGQIMPVTPESTGEAILEIRRRSGLTWEELGDLFDVSRRSVHHWASGKSVSARSERMIRRVLAAVRRLDQGSRSANRARLLAVDESLGVSTLELLKRGHFVEAVAWADGNPTPEYRPVPLSQVARDARRPPAPALLLEADQDRADMPAKARTVRAARAPKKTD